MEKLTQKISQMNTWKDCELKIKEQKLIKYETEDLGELIKFPIIEEKEATY